MITTLKSGISRHYFECACDSPDHVLRITHDRTYNDLYFEVQLNNHKSFFKRVKVAFKYVFNSVIRPGDHWDCTILEYNETIRLIKLLNEVLAGNPENSSTPAWKASKSAKDMFNSPCYTCEYFKNYYTDYSVCYKCQEKENHKTTTHQ